MLVDGSVPSGGFNVNISGGTYNVNNTSISGGTVMNNSVVQLTNANTLNFNSVLSGSGAVSVSGVSATFGGGAANSDTGTTTVAGGCMSTLNKTGGAVAVAGNLTIGGSTGGQEGVIMSQPNQFGANTVLTFSGGSSSYERFYLEGNNQTLAGVIDNSGGYSDIDNYYQDSSVLTFNLSTTNNFFNGTMCDNAYGTHSTTLGLTVSGSGMLTISGSPGTVNNEIDYTGPTTISGGTLALFDCTSFAFASAVTNNSVLQLNAMTINTAISGSGTVTVTGSSGVTLGGGAANSDTGTTTVGPGCTLTLSKTGGAVAVAGNLVISGALSSSTQTEVVMSQPNQFGAKPFSLLAAAAAASSGSTWRGIVKPLPASSTTPGDSPILTINMRMDPVF